MRKDADKISLHQTDYATKIHIFERPLKVQVSPHMHKFIELVFIQNGTGILNINDTSLTVNSGDLLFYNIGEIHCLNSDGQLSAVNLAISPEILSESLSTSQNAMDILALSWFNCFYEIIQDFKPKVSFTGKDRIEIEFIINRMLKEYTEKDTGYLCIIYGYLNVLFAKLFRQIYLEAKVNIREDMPSIADKVVSYIEQNYNKRISLDELARQSFYNPSYFSSIFKESLGVSPTQYINQKRLEKAMELLENTDDSIEYIMAMVGYSDKKHFYSLFKQTTGITPGEYRKKLKK